MPFALVLEWKQNSTQKFIYSGDLISESNGTFMIAKTFQFSPQHGASSLKRSLKMN